jgi:prolipoprotein diacylglyceryltransferase
MQIGHWWIDAFTLRILSATVTALIWLKWQATRREDIQRSHFGWWLLALSIGALLLGRVGYVWIHADYFQQHPRDVLDVREIGGVDGISALLGGLIVAATWAGVARQRLWPRLGLLTPAALWVGAAAWWACRDVGCAWGKIVSPLTGRPRWLIVEAPDLYQMFELRYPVRIWGLIWAVTMAGMAWALGKHGGWALTLYLIGGAGLTLLRGDSVPMIGSIRSDTAVQATLAVSLLISGGLYNWRTVRIARSNSSP